MKISSVDYKNQKIIIEIPLTQPTGKIRIKERQGYTDFGIPVATRQKVFNPNMYVEWQIGYDAELNSSKANLSRLKDRNDLIFKAYNGKKKVLYELSEYLYYLYKMGVISKQDVDTLERKIKNIPENSLIENSYKIYKSNPIRKTLNEMEFLESEIKYPHLIYDFDNDFFIIAEITIREKQKAIGIQPMVYICFPVSYLKDQNGNSIIGRKAEKNEKVYFELDKDKAFVVIDSFKIFGMLSKNHKHDILEILKVIK
ncbi:R.Pab1 family restriction endonuclease [Persephonella sp.]|uniref:R.Pab1 family restriction endonuclease n=1 Tax=Persephonella sp. TaxID=2060922 RepID=UPI0025F3CAE6|nr:R.Pab1 family restriction endonuclease [Persephonella sp.]